MRSQFSTFRLVAISSFALLILGLGVYQLVSFRDGYIAPATLTAGSELGLRHQIAENLSYELGTRGVSITVIPTSGSQESLEKVNRGEIDMALAQGGINCPEFANLRQAAVLHVEPLHLLIRIPSLDSSMLGQISLHQVSREVSSHPEIRVNTSTPGSGTHALSSSLLDFFGLEAGKDFQETHLTYEELLNPELPDSELPDAVFTVSSIPSPVAKYLINSRGFRPVELPVADAFRLDWSSNRMNEIEVSRVARRRIVQTLIPQHTYQVNPAVPDVPMKTLGTRLHLVAHKDVSPEVVERTIDSIYNSSLASMSDPPLSLSMLQNSSEFELHSGAIRYLEKKTPIITERVVELTEQVLAILGTIFGAGLFVWQGMLYFRRRRRDRQFLSCVDRVGEIQRRAAGYEQDETMKLADLIRLQDELGEIREELIQQFQDGYIDGADTLSGFLMHINDANENLTRMILHERKPRVSEAY